MTNVELHLIDDIEKLRGRVRRTCTQEIELLTEARLAALRGRREVVIDHIERTIDRLRLLRESV